MSPCRVLFASFVSPTSAFVKTIYQKSPIVALPKAASIKSTARPYTAYFGSILCVNEELVAVLLADVGKVRAGGYYKRATGHKEHSERVLLGRDGRTRASGAIDQVITSVPLVMRPVLSWIWGRDAYFPLFGYFDTGLGPQTESIVITRLGHVHHPTERSPAHFADPRGP